MVRLIFVCLFLIIFSACDQVSTTNESFLKIKELEYNRVSDSTEWNKIQNSREFNALKYSFVTSIGKTRLDQLTPIVQDILVSSRDDSLTGECIFALGQIGSDKAEQILINIPFNQLSLKNKKKVIAALSHCASDEVINFYMQHIDDPALKSDVLINAAICSRQNISVSKIKSVVLDSASIAKPFRALSYFMYYAGNRNDFDKLIQIAENSEDLGYKYAIKKLNAVFFKNQNYFSKHIALDSTLADSYNRLMQKSLKKTMPWEIHFYAIPLAAALKDSIITKRIYSLTKSANNHVALTAFEFLAQADAELAISALLEEFGKEQTLYTRGKIIKILAEYYPEKAYSFVMQNLDKGDSKFKAQLLDALATIQSKMALRTLKQFINVDDPILICSAFENLKKLGILTNSDLSTLLNSEHFSCAASAIGYYLEKNKNIDTDLLLKIYKKFNRTSQCEAQIQIVTYFKNTPLPSPIFADSLMQYASHNIVRRLVFEQFQNLLSEPWLNWEFKFNYAHHLLPDSIEYYSDNPIIEIATVRGDIQIELYPDIAPYTVNSFLSLVNKNFYNGLTFHRVVPDFVIQGGDPTGSGWGGPDYLIPSEDNSLPFISGSVGMATSGFDTGSSQFFICHSEQPHLGGNYTLFGQVIKGMETVQSILPEDKILTIKLL